MWQFIKQSSGTYDRSSDDKPFYRKPAVLVQSLIFGVKRDGCRRSELTSPINQWSARNSTGSRVPEIRYGHVLFAAMFQISTKNYSTYWPPPLPKKNLTVCSEVHRVLFSIYTCMVNINLENQPHPQSYSLYRYIFPH